MSDDGLSGDRAAKIVIGLPTHNSEEHIGDAIRSLLDLDWPNLAVVAVDDCSTDSTVDIASRYAASDPRLTIDRNPRRLGMIANWNRALALAYERHPDMAYFAWASDNDVREPQWAPALVAALEANPDAVIAYSRFGTIVEGERTIPDPPRWIFETTGIERPVRRLLATTRGMRAGPTMYGLHRRATLERAGAIPPILLSDFIFLSHLSLHGTFVQVPEVLWYRELRRVTGSSTRRQRAALFARPPRWTYLPVSIQHTSWLFRRLVAARERPDGVGVVTAGAVVAIYQADWGLRLGRRFVKIVRKRMRRHRHRARKAARRLRKTAVRSFRPRRLRKTAVRSFRPRRLRSVGRRLRHKVRRNSVAGR